MYTRDSASSVRVATAPVAESRVLKTCESSALQSRAPPNETLRRALSFCATHARNEFLGETPFIASSTRPTSSFGDAWKRKSLVCHHGNGGRRDGATAVNSLLR